MAKGFKIGDSEYYFLSAAPDEGWDKQLKNRNPQLLDFVIYANAGYVMAREAVRVSSDAAKAFANYLLDEIRKHEDKDVAF